MEGSTYNYARQLHGNHPHQRGVVVGAVSVPMGDMWVWDQFFRDEREGRRRIYELMKGQFRHHVLRATRKSLPDAVLFFFAQGIFGCLAFFFSHIRARRGGERKESPLAIIFLLQLAAEGIKVSDVAVDQISAANFVATRI